MEAEERSDVRAGVNSENCKTYKFLHIFVTQDEQLDDYLKQAAKVIATVKGKKVGVLKHQ